MNTTGYHYIDTLEGILSQRQKANSSYSLRSYARDLGMHPATLSMVLNRKRELPKKNLNPVLNKLVLSPIQESVFRESYYRSKTNLDQMKIHHELVERTILDERYYKIIAEWEYYAVLTYFEIKTSEHTAEAVAREFGISVKRAELVLKELVQIGFLKQEEGRFINTVGPLKTTEDVSSRALRESHKESLEIAKQKIEEVAVEHRDFSSMTVAVNPSKLPEAKALIREFRKKLGSLLSEGETEEVYQFAMQLFPLSKTNKNIGDKK